MTSFAMQGANVTIDGQSIRDVVRQSVNEARSAAREAQQEQAQVAREQMDAAMAKMRAAEAQLKAAKTADQRGAAEQAMFSAGQAIREAAQQQAVQGITVMPPINPAEMIPPQVEDISIAFFVMLAVIIVGWPLARAFGKRIERRSMVTSLDPQVTTQLQRMEQTMDSMAIEIERISESQRFMAKLQQEQKVALPVGSAPR